MNDEIAALVATAARLPAAERQELIEHPRLTGVDIRAALAYAAEQRGRSGRDSPE